MNTKQKLNESFIDCPEAEDLVQYIEERLPVEVNERIVRHLDICKRCRGATVELMKLKKRLGQSSLEDDNSPNDTIYQVIGSKIGRYIIVGHIGSGGMGEVFAAYDPELDRKVALKLVHSDLMDENSETMRARLMREAQAMAKLSHPNVISIYEVLSIDSGVAVVMEYVDGMTLGKWCRVEKRSWKEVLKMYIDAGEGLNAAHQAGLVHRDFKPENVLVRKDGRVFVTDFGLVRQASEGVNVLGDNSMQMLGKEDIISQKTLRATLTRAGALMGTPAYMSPEQLQGKEVDARADQYSFFVSLFEGVYEERPIEAESIEEYQRLTSSKEIVAPKKSDVPQWLKTIVLKGLSKEPEMRFGSMQVALNALRRDPSARRRSISIAVSLMIVTAIGTGFAISTATGRAKRCEVPRDEFAGVWDGKTQERILSNFLASKKGYAKDVYERFAKQIDLYVDQWKNGLVEACRDTHERELYSQTILAQRVDCLRESRATLELLLGKLAGEPDETAIENSVSAVLGLPSLALCRSYAYLSKKSDTETSAGVGARAEPVQRIIREAVVFEKLGQYNKGCALVEDMLAGAAALSSPRHTADALLWSGILNERCGNYARAEQLLTDAMRMYGILSDTDGYVHALERYLFTIGVMQERFDEANALVQYASPNTLRAAKVDPRRLGRFLNTLGVISFRQGMMDKSIDELQTAVTINEQAFGQFHTEVRAALYNLAIAYSKVGRFEEAENYYRRVWKIEQDVFGPNHPAVGSAIISLAENFQDLGFLDKARELAEQAVAIYRSAIGSDHPLMAYGLNTLGSIYLDEGKIADANRCYNEALVIARTKFGPRYSLVGEIHLGIGNIYLFQNNLKMARRNFEEAVAILGTKPGDANLYASARFGLAKALFSDKTRRLEALSLAQQVKSYLTVHKDTASRKMQVEIETWIKKTTGS